MLAARVVHELQLGWGETQCFPLYNCTSTETLNGCWCGFQLLAGAGVRTQVDGVSQRNTCGTKAGDICKGYMVAVLVIGFLSSKLF